MPGEGLFPGDLVDRKPVFLKKERKNAGLTLRAVTRKKNGVVFPVEIVTKLVKIGGETFRFAYIRDLSGFFEKDRGKAADVGKNYYFTRNLPDPVEIPELVFETDVNGIVQSVNKYFFELTGYKEEDIKKGLNIVELVQPELKDIARERVRRLFAGEKLESNEYIARKKDGTAIPIMVHSEAIEENGTIKGMRTHVIDLTDHKRLENNLINMERFHALGELSGSIMHDISNILFIIHGFVDLELASGDDYAGHPEYKECLERIKKAARDGTDILKRIHDFNRESSPQEPESISVNDSVEEVVELLRPEWETGASEKNTGISIEKHLETIPRIHAKPAEIKEVLSNLIINAIEAIDGDGVITITTSYRDGFIIISIADTGVGMSEDIQAKVFDSFFSTKGEKGTGLGLYVSRNIVQKYCGEIHVESREGVGSTFRVILPVKKEDKVPVTEQEPVDAKKYTILVIDDEKNVCEIMDEFLSMEGYTVLTARNGTEGVKLLDREAYDVVITDLNMPDITGLDVAEYVKKKSPRTSVIILTGWGNESNELEQCTALIERVIAKPVDFNYLRETLHEVLREKNPKP
jgi:PAS domain S-box-containing protein